MRMNSVTRGQRCSSAMGSLGQMDQASWGFIMEYDGIIHTLNIYICVCECGFGNRI